MLLQLDAWSDGEISDDRALREHLDACPQCSVEARIRNDLHAEIRTFADTASACSAERVESICVAVSEKLKTARIASENTNTEEGEGKTTDVVSHPKVHARVSFGSLLVGLAAGFLLALGIFRPWDRDIARALPSVLSQDAQGDAFNNQLGILTVASKPVRARLVGQESWKPIKAASSIPIKCELQTDGTLCCEIEKPNGCLLRIDRHSELTIDTSERYQLNAGQIWVEAKPSNPVEIVAADLKIKTTGACNAERVGGFVNLVSFERPVSVTGKNWSHILGANSVATFDATGRLISNTSNHPTPASKLDLILASAWIHELMDQRKPQLQFELRLSSLCGGLEGDKLKTCEAELRRIGPAAADALLIWLKASANQSNLKQARHKASELLAAFATYSQTTALIELLADADPVVTRNLERGLERITGHSPQTPYLKARYPQQERWKRWWDNERKGLERLQYESNTRPKQKA